MPGSVHRCCRYILLSPSRKNTSSLSVCDILYRITKQPVWDRLNVGVCRIAKSPSLPLRVSTSILLPNWKEKFGLFYSHQKLMTRSTRILLWTVPFKHESSLPATPLRLERINRVVSFISSVHLWLRLSATRKVNVSHLDGQIWTNLYHSFSKSLLFTFWRVSPFPHSLWFFWGWVSAIPFFKSAIHWNFQVRWNWKS